MPIKYAFCMGEGFGSRKECAKTIYTVDCLKLKLIQSEEIVAMVMESLKNNHVMVTYNSHPEFNT